MLFKLMQLHSLSLTGKHNPKCLHMTVVQSEYIL